MSDLNRFDRLGSVGDDGLAVVTGVSAYGRWFALAGNGDWCFIKAATARQLVALGVDLREKKEEQPEKDEKPVAKVAEKDLG